MESFSLSSLLINASVFVQLIAFVLLALSVISWSILFYTVKSLIAVRKDVLHIRSMTSSIEGMSPLYTQHHYSATYDIFKRFLNLWDAMGAQSSNVLDATLMYVDDVRDRIGLFVPWLGTIASASPFIGLLGTVWGIMSSFQSIAQTKETHLAVVAPGIAEALAVTALGLIVAIPATIMYNMLTKALDSYSSCVSDLLLQCVQTLSKKG